MIKILKYANIKRIACSIIVACIACLILSIIIYKGQYFQNWLNSDYTPYKKIILSGWLLLFVYYGACLYLLSKTNSKENNYLFFFLIQFFSFAVYLISVYCLAAYILATVSSILSIIFSACLSVSLFRNKRYVLMLFVTVIIIIYLYCVVKGILYCSIEYGVWKN